MLLQGNFKIPTDREKVWRFVSDLGRVIECVPGLQSYTLLEGKRVSASVRVSIGLIRGTFQTIGRLVEDDARTHTSKIELTGSGAGSGFNAVVDIGIAAIDAESELAWKADVRISGPLGSLAKPLIEGNVKKIVTQLLDCVKAKLSSP
jgi:uncharacterized protein